jgi:hypothetical protein
METERIGETVVDVEQRADLDRVLYSRIAHAGGAEWFHIRRPHVRRGEGELLEEAERRAQLWVERCRAPIGQNRFDQRGIFLFVLEGQRRDRAVSAGSK